MSNRLLCYSLCVTFAFAGVAPVHAALRMVLNVSAKPIPHLSAWMEHRTSVFATIINTGAQSVKVKFDCQIKRDGNVQAKTDFGKMLTIDIPAGTAQYYAEDLVPYDALSVYGNAGLAAFKTGMIPAGNYEFCAVLLDPNTRVPLTPIICKSFTVLSYQAPMLLSPADQAELPIAGRPVFRWTAVSPRPSTPVTYRVTVYEVMPGQSPSTALRANKPILDRDVTTMTQLLWPPDIELPRPNMRYIWLVRATDENHAPYGEPDGRSEPWTFVLTNRNSSARVLENPGAPDTTGRVKSPK